MLENLDLDMWMDQAEWDAVSGELKKKLGVLQQRARALKIPTVIVFEGWGASGKGDKLSRLITNLDPRGFSVHSITAPSTDERRYPWMKRFWEKLPTYGDIALFDRSWYREVSVAREDEALSRRELNHRYDEIVDFEHQITDDGYVLVKFFFHISKKEQKKRFKALEEKKATRWRVTKADWDHNEHYDDYLTAFDEMISRTDRHNAPWTVVAATDRRYATHKVFTTVIAALERAIEDRQSGIERPFTGIRVSDDIRTEPCARLCDVDLSRSVSEEEYRKELKNCQKRLSELHGRLYLEKIPLILAYEGWDAAGKGGNIKRIAQALDARGYEVVPVAAPSTVEKNHPHLWRFWNTLPKDGHVAIFDRTWYGRVLVEHIEGFCTDEQWGRAYDEINRFERGLADWGAIILKFWLHIDKDEQLRRFNDRQNTPEKRYKITDEDWRNREKWDAYEQAVDEMLLRTNTSFAPWFVIESNDKRYARLRTLHAVIDAIEKRL
ncbi:polyphosphate:AMP phosphotransferase [Anaerotruncus colihominis]|uniref:polyphosphate:AMP phosphotransferase n=1 Tax=Anaerotruncus colihominis TaxID=169435 RepID=UPI00242DCC10|nr:polyphosphate:AMP phosphotransferase [Anaerotruncus colihominis]